MSSTIIGATVAGAICGLVPLVYGLARGETGLGLAGFAACLIAGVVLGVLLAVPLAALFAWLIWRHSREAHADRLAARAPAGTRPDTPAAETDDGRFDRDPADDREPTARR
jgi:Zn-dependent protease with chaperone function